MDYHKLCIPGDLLLYQHPEGVGLISRGIRLIEGNKVVHCSIVVQNKGGVVLVAEINSDYKARVAPIETSSALELPMVARNTQLTIDEERLFATANKLVGSSYAFERVGDALINHLTGWFKVPPRSYLSSENPRRFICSTLTSYLLSQCSTWKYNPIAEPDDFTVAPWLPVVG
jgi:hypothetical protein